MGGEEGAEGGADGGAEGVGVVGGEVGEDEGLFDFVDLGELEDDDDGVVSKVGLAGVGVERERVLTSRGGSGRGDIVLSCWLCLAVRRWSERRGEERRG